MATPTSHNGAESRTVWVAMAACLVMMAHYVGSKAIRDAFFLSQFGITSLPAMVIAASLFSIAAVLGASGALRRFTPARFVPAAFAASAVLHLAIWGLMGVLPRVCAVLIYLQSVALGAILTSGFWSLLNERFDPRTAKSLIGRIAGAGTFGGMVGGFAAERVAAWASLSALLPVLAVYHVVCAATLVVVRQPNSVTHGGTAAAAAEEDPSGFDLVRNAPYLRTLAALVILGTISAAMLDYVFKAAALAHYGKGETLLRFFALFYSATGVVTFLLQTGLSGFALSRLGTARTVGAMPMAVTLGGLTALVAPGLVSATFARAIEVVFRGSLFRAGYEIFFTPMPLREKRAAKAVVDVGFDRLGDAIGGGLVSVILAAAATVATPAIVTGAVLVALGGIWVASRLEGAYIDALEHGLRDRGGDLVEQALGGNLASSGFAETIPMVDSTFAASDLTFSSLPVITREPAARPSLPSQPAAANSAALHLDPVVQEIATLRSGNAKEVRRALGSTLPLSAHTVSHVIALLAWDEAADAATDRLRAHTDQFMGQLLDSLLNPDTDFSIRRRLPRILTASPLQRVANGLLLGLNDRRFEVRFQCGRALASCKARNRLLRFSHEEVFGFIRKEVAVSKPVWDSHRLLDRLEDTEATVEFDEFVRDRASRSLQHLFTLLSLVLPADPLKIAFQGLHTEDAHLRGTALEYLSSILPPDIRERLWPLLERTDTAPKIRDTRPREEILAELMSSDHSIMIRLEELRKKPDRPPPA